MYILPERSNKSKLIHNIPSMITFYKMKVCTSNGLIWYYWSETFRLKKISISHCSCHEFLNDETINILVNSFDTLSCRPIRLISSTDWNTQNPFGWSFFLKEKQLTYFCSQCGYSHPDSTTNNIFWIEFEIFLPFSARILSLIWCTEHIT